MPCRTQLGELIRDSSKKSSKMGNSLWSLKTMMVLWCLFQLNWSNVAAAESFLAKEKQLLDTLLHHSRYDPRIRPLGVNASGRDPATNVSVNLYLTAITNIDDVKMKCTIQMLLRQRWEDRRLTYDDYGGKLPYLSLTDKSKIWQPDLFFPSEIGSNLNSVLSPNSFIRILDGQVFTSNRVTLTISCPMDLKWYPFDSQECDLQMESYGMNSKDLVFMWDEDTPVRSGIFRLPRFSLDKLTTTTTHARSKTGEYNGLKLQLHLKRHLTPSVLQAFLPSVMLVCVSWLSFWLDSQAVVARVIIGVATLLAAAAHSFAFSWSTASVDYITSIDFWFGTCLSFVFAALLQSILVNYEIRRNAKKPVQSDDLLEDANGKKRTLEKKRVQGESEDGGFQKYHQWMAKLPTGPARLDILSRCLFPIGFAVFNIFYWFINLCHG